MDNSNQSSAGSTVTVRVDLTSQDLRTGTVRLPRQLRNRFEAGPLTATVEETDDHLALDFAPPGDLTGLQEFLQHTELKTNDAIVLHVDGTDIRLEPFYRRPRAQPAAEPQQQSDQGLFGEVQEPAVHDDDRNPEHNTQDGDPVQLNPELQPGLFDDDSGSPAAVAATTLNNPAPDAEPPVSTALPAEEETPGTGEPAAAKASEQEQYEEHTPAAAAADSDFAAWADDDDPELDAFDAGLASFAAASEPDHPQPDYRQNAFTQAYPAPEPAAGTEADEELPPLPAWQAPAAAEPEPITEEARTPDPPVAEHSPFHAVQRRPFTPRGPSMPAVATASRTGTSAATSTAPAANAQHPFAADQPVSSANVTSAQDTAIAAGREPAQAQHTGEPDGAAQPVSPPEPDSPIQMVRRHLDSPGLPSILQAKQLAQELNLTEEDAVDALQELSQLPDSRLSTVRPGFYLLKQSRED